MSTAAITINITPSTFCNGVKSNDEVASLLFYLKNDICESKKDIDKRLTPDLEFSNFFHRLRSCGYKNYVFNLAKHLAYDIELMRMFVKDIVYVFKYVGRHTFGVLTVFHNDEHKWYVKVTPSSIMRHTNKIIDVEMPIQFN